MPASLRDVLVSRLEVLPAASRHLLRVCAVAGRQIEEPLLRAVLSMTAPELAAVVRPAVAHHLLRPLPDGAGTSSGTSWCARPPTPNCCPASGWPCTPPSPRGWPSSRTSPDAAELSRIAHHWCAAEDDAHAVPALVAAGAAALRAGGFVEAYAHLAGAAPRWLALGWEPSDEVGPGLTLAEVTRMALHAAALGSDITDARRLGDAVLAVLDPETAPQEYAALVGWLGLHRMLDGDNAGAHEAYTRALELLPPSPRPGCGPGCWPGTPRCACC